MTLPVISGASLALSQIQTEFGGSNPISMSEYYAGGSYVGSGTANSTSVAIPTSGAISFANFSGASAIIQKYNGTITAGTYDTGADYYGYWEQYYGWQSTAPIGSRSPTTLTDGKSLVSWYQVTHYAPFYVVTGTDTYLEINGFSSDPGSSYVQYVTVGSTNYYTSSASVYYGSGKKTYVWNSAISIGALKIYGS